ncbi:MAG TPA: toll/interleukin-1 receptor domain-containing protein [Ktedonobacterales bacterium]
MGDAARTRIFISHHHSQREDDFTARLEADLTATGASVRTDSDSETRDAFVQLFLTPYAGRQFFLFVVTPDAAASPWVQREVGVALHERAAGRVLAVIPILLVPTPAGDIPPAWLQLDVIDATRSYEPAHAALLRALSLVGPALSEQLAPEWPEWEPETFDDAATKGFADSLPGTTAPLTQRDIEQAVEDAWATASGEHDVESHPAAVGAQDDAPSASQDADARPPEKSSTGAPSPAGAAPASGGAPPDEAAAGAQTRREPAAPPAPVDAHTDGQALAPPFPMAPPPMPWPAAPPSPAGTPAPTLPPQPPYPEWPPAGATAPETAPGGGDRSTGAPQGVSPISLEQVAFAAYHPKEVERNKPSPLLVFLALNTAGALAQVAALAAERLAGRIDQFRAGVADDRLTIRRGARLRIVPTIPGFRVNPQWMDITWEDDAQQHEFTIRAESAASGRASEGAVRIYQGLTLRAEVPLSIYVGSGAAASDPASFASAVARTYRRVFASYSHRDTPVVESCEAAAQALGDRYLRDVMTLQSGQLWNSQLLRMINEADVFQLFWSKNASSSGYVRQEWEYALTLQPNRPGFIRPVYWSGQPFGIPQQLSALHFEPLDLSALGWGPVRRFFYLIQAG